MEALLRTTWAARAARWRYRSSMCSDVWQSERSILIWRQRKAESWREGRRREVETVSRFAAPPPRGKTHPEGVGLDPGGSEALGLSRSNRGVGEDDVRRSSPLLQPPGAVSFRRLQQPPRFGDGGRPRGGGVGGGGGRGRSRRGRGGDRRGASSRLGRAGGRGGGRGGQSPPASGCSRGSPSHRDRGRRGSDDSRTPAPGSDRRRPVADRSVFGRGSPQVGQELGPLLFLPPPPHSLPLLLRSVHDVSFDWSRRRRRRRSRQTVPASPVSCLQTESGGDWLRGSGAGRRISRRRSAGRGRRSSGGSGW